jgi:hypothetical protein
MRPFGAGVIKLYYFLHDKAIARAEPLGLDRNRAAPAYWIS